MFEFNVDHNVNITLPESDRAAEVVRRFGLRRCRIRQRYHSYKLRMKVLPGDIVYINGPSGSGKSVLLNKLYKQAPQEKRLRLEDIPLPDDKPVIDCIGGSVLKAAGTLSKAVLSDVFYMLQSPAQLSTGQRFRFRMAQALDSDAAFIFADEVTASLGRIAALSLAWRLARLAPSSKKVFIFASCHEDILCELRPEIFIKTSMNGSLKVMYKDPKRDPDPQRFGAFRLTKYPFGELKEKNPLTNKS